MVLREKLARLAISLNESPSRSLSRRTFAYIDMVCASSLHRSGRLQGEGKHPGQFSARTAAVCWSIFNAPQQLAVLPARAARAAADQVHVELIQHAAIPGTSRISCIFVPPASWKLKSAMTDGWTLIWGGVRPASLAGRCRTARAATPCLDDLKGLTGT